MNLQVLNKRELLGKQFVIYGDLENPLFLARDVAEWIDYDLSSVNKLVSQVDDDEKVRKNVPTLGGNQEMWLLTEDGLYEVLMQSRKPIAKEFKKKVKEILKDIRSKGMYATDELLDNPDLLIKVATQLKEERAARKELETEVKRQGQIIGELRPKADYVDRILKSKSLLNIGQIAKDYGLSGQALNKILHNLKVQYKQGNQWLLYSKYQSKGYTHSESIDIQLSDGSTKVELRTKWTQKGRLFLYELLKDNGYFPMIERN